MCAKYASNNNISFINLDGNNSENMQRVKRSYVSYSINQPKIRSYLQEGFSEMCDHNLSTISQFPSQGAW